MKDKRITARALLIGVVSAAYFAIMTVRVEWRHDDDSIWYELLRFSRVSRSLPPPVPFYVHGLQARFARDSQRAMVAALDE